MSIFRWSVCKGGLVRQVPLYSGVCVVCTYVRMNTLQQYNTHMYQSVANSAHSPIRVLQIGDFTGPDQWQWLAHVHLVPCCCKGVAVLPSYLTWRWCTDF